MPTTDRATRALTLLITSLGSFMVLLDGSIIFVALPEIQRSLGVELSSLQWTVDAYTLPFAALMLTAGTLGDRLGRKRVFLAGLVLFLVGSALCGFAPGLTALIVGRVVQGIGAAAINTGSLALLVSTLTDPPGRAKAIGIWTAVSGVSLALGPLVGGTLIDLFSWNAIFLVNLPVGAVALLLGVRRLQESRNPQARRLDVPGQVLVAGGLFCLVMGVIQGERQGWTDPLILALLGAALVLLVAFAIVERRSREPLLPLELFRNRTFTAATGIAVLLGFVIVGAMFFLAQYFMVVQNHSPLAAGLRLLPLTLGIFFFSPPASRIAGKVGPRIPIISGALLATGGFLLLTTLTADAGFGAVWWKVALVGAGIGCMFAPLTIAVMGSVPPQRSGLGSSMINAARITGFTTGAAVLGTVVLAQFKDHLTVALTGLGVPAAGAGALAERFGGAGAFAGGQLAAGAVPVDPAAFRAAVGGSFVEAVHTAFLVCAGGTFLAAVLATALMVRGRLPAPTPATAAPATQAAAPAPQTAGAARVGEPSPLVSTEWLADRLGQPGLRVVDCTVVHRPLPEGGVTLESGVDGYREGHIPGAVFADLLARFSDPAQPKPFAVPSVEHLTDAIEEIGISSTDTVVLYDRAHTAFATRFWSLLQSLGFDALVLDGGWRKWTAEGRPVSTEAPAVARGHVVAKPRPELFVSRDQVLAATDDRSTCLLNALSNDQHEGRIPVAHGRRGHIPSRVTVPAAELLDPRTGAFLPASSLTSRLAEAGALAATTVIAYCAAGVDATSPAFVLKMLGADNVAVSGLAEWSRDPAMPLDATA